MIKRLWILAGLFAVALVAQTPTPLPGPGPARFPIWSADLPGGKYSVDVGTITSVSTHEFRVDSVVRVVECTIDTQGSVVARFYFLEPVQLIKAPGGIGQSALDAAQSKLKEAAELVAGTGAVEAVWQKVEKSYPVATHAHTVEYRLGSEEEVKALYTSAERSWRLRQRGAYRPGEKTSE